MIAWPAPTRTPLPGRGDVPTIHDTATAGPRRLEVVDGRVGVYVCGITPYDATHMGHAATYVTVDVLNRALLDAGAEVTFVENVTDVDDPLLERAERDGVGWRELATREIQLFRDDMTALAVFPPDHFAGVVESVDLIGRDVRALLEEGAAYCIGTPDADGRGLEDVYLDLTTRPDFGRTSRFSTSDMDDVFADRGGDPDRAGKRSRFDPLLWRAARPGEPQWDVPGLPTGRPGWHIECSAIAVEYLGPRFAVQCGGSDLVFPHHEMSAVQAAALHGDGAFAQAYLHQAMVGLDGEKMSKSKGNLVLVSRLRQAGEDPAAIRLVLLAHHYRAPWDWTQEVFDEGRLRLTRWRDADARTCDAVTQGSTGTTGLLGEVRARVADDLDTPGALATVDAWIEDGADPAALGGASLHHIVDTILGIRL
ncbi:cysteine--1-D-myo-inosityl 2-amino-2-deoxy-alpha-D-glucopyranoside ligase [Mobilicoccus pelagius]|uniref:L-cysteine:1D-myo-inositol 2-amino-2-deoxy-alpha-D-glucopyranoside ligase n=1 Tax=Mobilicoccus pelagius NBRC 104925 TaxID=1089455 RepID=H5UTH3_9MICO|nr:cysteine--1-D-myo-inosityl 2-amino-2-deoxy-alpha-D-glucopyranoside ligase [Mobilicoccus pelagius]GAB49031.1 cysteine--1D-myo-inosityl 2-amino-2-deoxy-alpha-D-glucopyranoside ligase MshC [Mobilicoccus pelagius NBRC 104925]